MLKAERVCYKLGNLLKAEVNIGKISESKYGNIACMHFEARGSLRNLDVLRQLSAIFVFVLFAMQYKVCLGSTKRYHLL